MKFTVEKNFAQHDFREALTKKLRYTFLDFLAILPIVGIMIPGSLGRILPFNHLTRRNDDVQSV